MDKEINAAIELLRKNGYIVKKFTENMKIDADECEQMQESGEYKECIDCSCSVCIVN